MVMQREATTIRFPAGVLALARSVKPPGQSLNDFVVSILEREVRREQGLAAYRDVLVRRACTRQRTGLQPASAPLIRDLRELAS